VELIKNASPIFFPLCPLRYYFVPFVVYPFLTAKNAKKSTAKNAKIKGKRNHRKFTKLQIKGTVPNFGKGTWIK
ncbi:MAG: hypothetical protein AB1414_08405, partial [bacterium]